EALKNNWEGHEDLRQLCLEAPKFGNDDDYVDLITFELGKRLKEEAAKIKTYFGKPLYLDGTAASAFWLHGMTCPATPDGRKNADTLHDGSISPMGGRDTNGPTASLKSVSKVDPLQTFNHLFNQTFMPQYLDGHNREAFGQYLKTYGDLGVHHIQFSVVGRDTLEEAQTHPENHTNLMVRVCGYSAYFIDLAKGIQDGIISRTSQCLTC
ncbi:MAG: glycine radical domain-containing protein, partial [Thermodesulfobacteriota bacterium]|nr:glycine radical domain-containing protein [Thermodesulfobacteriota bacterium]